MLRYGLGVVFRLHKWYLDCVDERGSAAIVYAATLRWGVLSLCYSALLGRCEGRHLAAMHMRKPQVPALTDDTIRFADPRLAVAGEWRGPRVPREQTLWTSPRGAVRWHCHMPRADVQLTVAGHELSGWGYVEHLALDVAPWHLPIEELRWGRFHADARSLVWIEWRGPHPLRLCLCDGVAAAIGPVGDRGFELNDGGSLRLAEPDVLRDGRLGKTVLAERLLRWLPLPRAVRAMRESKWLARGEWRDGERVLAGHAVHEVVRWN